MPISSAVLNQTQRSAETLADEVAVHTQGMQHTALAHRSACDTQARLFSELNELAQFLDENHHQGISDWSDQLHRKILTSLVGVDALDLGVLNRGSSPSTIDAQASAKDSTHARVNDGVYKIRRDDRGDLRFVPNTIVAQTFETTRQQGVLDLRKLSSMTSNGYFSEQEHIEFVILSTGPTVPSLQTMFPAATITLLP